MNQSEFYNAVAAIIGAMANRDGERKRPCCDCRTMKRRTWDLKHLCTVGTKVTADEGERFRELCSDCGLTVYAALQLYVRDCLQKRALV